MGSSGDTIDMSSKSWPNGFKKLRQVRAVLQREERRVAVLEHERPVALEHERRVALERARGLLHAFGYIAALD